MLSILDRESLYAKESKYEFGMTELLYLGHIISANGVQVDPKKIRAIVEWPTPTTLHSLRDSLVYVVFIGGLLRDSHKFLHP